MATIEHSIHINRSPDDVWAVAGDFWSLGDWNPALPSCEKTGDDVRTLRMGDIEIEEQMLERDERARTIAYTITKSPAPLEYHRADWSVAPDGDGSKFTIKAEIRPDDAIALFDPVYKQSTEDMRKHLEA
jgi:hypothetical protein